MNILVTGGTGTLGKPTVRLLRAAGHSVRVLSRKPGVGRMLGDLSTGEGLAAAITGVDTVLHLANGMSKEADQTRRLVEAARAAGVSHLVYISIVGVDLIPFSYYKQKLASEKVVESSGVPFTILRATQFHDFPAMFFRMQRRLPVYLSLNVLDQPIEVGEVAARLLELTEGKPAGRVADIGGPEQLSVQKLIELWQTAHGTNRKIWTLKLPGATMRAFAAGHHLTELPGYGTRTFEEYATADAAGTAG